MTTFILIALALIANLELFLLSSSSWKTKVILALAIVAVMFALSRLNRRL